MFTNALVCFSIVLILIFFENAAKMVFIQGLGRVQTLFANRAYLPFSESIHIEFLKDAVRKAYIVGWEKGLKCFCDLVITVGN